MRELAFQRAQEWSQNSYFAQADREEINQLLSTNQETEIIERFYKDLEFGTGGLRAKIGMGSNCMNRYTVRKATAALCLTLQESFPSESPSVVLSYDSRRFSWEFAQEAASVIAGHGMKAYIFDRLTPTPLLSYAVRYLKTFAGIMITASHNPPHDNGYKAYWRDGAQVTPPYDQKIIDHYNALNDFRQIQYCPFDQAKKQGLIEMVGEDVYGAYFTQLKEKFFNLDLCQQRGHELKVVYTPIHGTGLYLANRVAKMMGPIQFLPVPEQAQPDGSFPTVSYPNPEDPKALKMAVDLMMKEQADVVVGSDPDADRIGVVVNHHGTPYYLNGNQTGILLLHYVLANLKRKISDFSNHVVIKSIVTSEMQTAICEHFKIPIFSTLTGFKWMCGLFRELELKRPGLQLAFASEESFGYLVNGNDVRDKDAMSSLGMTMEMALWYKTQRNCNLVEALDEIYKEIGFYQESLLSLNYLGIEGSQKIGRIMDFFRSYGADMMLTHRIARVTDYQTGEVIHRTSGRREKLDFSEKSNVLGFFFEDGNILYLRPSGTEPKIKFYFLLKDSSTDSLSVKREKLEKVSVDFQNFIRNTVENL